LPGPLGDLGEDGGRGEPAAWDAVEGDEGGADLAGAEGEGGSGGAGASAAAVKTRAAAAAAVWTVLRTALLQAAWERRQERCGGDDGADPAACATAAAATVVERVVRLVTVCIRQDWARVGWLWPLPSRRLVAGVSLVAGGGGIGRACLPAGAVGGCPSWLSLSRLFSAGLPALVACRLVRWGWGLPVRLLRLRQGGCGRWWRVALCLVLL
jgi:hypothetical protein